MTSFVLMRKNIKFTRKREMEERERERRKREKESEGVNK